MKKLGISLEEVNQILVNRSSFFESNQEFTYVLGFSEKRKFLQVAYRNSKKPNFDIEVLQIDLAYEKDIKKYWCKG
ncbi:MAG: hypothetical protein K2U26_06110 [Cyclobacteriaceae bacterium]|nr:hypothetical protein [Cyclobacteriaceae bacterium]